MQYSELKPAGHLALFIKCFWILDDPSPSGEEQRIVPDGRPELIFNLGKPFEHQVDGVWSTQPQTFIAGQITRPLLLRARGSTRVLGIRFLPHGASHMLGLPFHELTDCAIALADLSTTLHQCLQVLGDFNTLSLGMAALERAVSEIAPHEPHDALIPAAVHELERDGGSAGVAEVAHRIGLSQRQLQRRFREAVGISPKLFSRMQRFQRVFRTMEQHPADWASTAVECGYYDQAHLIRDFQDFTGKSPTSLVAEEMGLSRQFFATGTKP